MRLRLLLAFCIALLLTGTLAAQDTPDARVNDMATTLNLRQAPSPFAPVITELAGRTPLTVIGRSANNMWLKVETDGQTGWVSVSYLDVYISLANVPVLTESVTNTPTTATTDAAQPPVTSAPVTGEAGASVKMGIGTLRLRQGPNLIAAILAELPSGTPLEVLGRSEDGGWLNVNTSYGTGWVSAAYVVYGGAPVPVTNGGDTTAPSLPPAGNITGVSAIYRRGQSLGNQRNVFAKVGDSITVSEYALDALGRGQYNLGGFGGLQGMVNTFAGGVNSFTRVSQAAGPGWTTATVLAPTCNGISPLECEINAIRPAIALIELGTNDVQYFNTEQFGYNLNRIVDICIEKGVVPVLATIPHREGYGAQVDAFNDIIRGVAASRGLPIWDVKGALDGLPNRGLSGDGIHPSWPPAGWIDSANFANPEALASGHTARNLSALHVLNSVLAAMR